MRNVWKPLSLLVLITLCPPLAATGAAPATVEGCLEVATEVAADLGVQIDLRRAEEGLLAFSTGKQRQMIFGDEREGSFLIYQLVADGSQVGYRAMYVVGNLHLIGTPKGRAYPDRAREIHRTLNKQLRRAGVKMRELSYPPVPPPGFVAYADELKDGEEGEEAEVGGEPSQ